MLYGKYVFPKLSSTYLLIVTRIVTNTRQTEQNQDSHCYNKTRRNSSWTNQVSASYRRNLKFRPVWESLNEFQLFPDAVSKTIDNQLVANLWFTYGSNFSKLWKLNEKIQKSPLKCFRGRFWAIFRNSELRRCSGGNVPPEAIIDQFWIILK